MGEDTFYYVRMLGLRFPREVQWSVTMSEIHAQRLRP